MCGMTIQTIKEYFGTEKRPVTNEELIELRKSDADGYAELSRLTEEALGKS